MAQRQLVLPRGAIKMRSLDSHDSYWRPREFRRATFGVPAARAVVGFFAFIEGGFMDYNGADRGSEAFYRRVMHLRRTEPALKNGACDYLAVRPTDRMAIAPLRQGGGQTLLPLSTSTIVPPASACPCRFAREPRRRRLHGARPDDTASSLARTAAASGGARR
jgi:hypothetical protein